MLRVLVANLQACICCALQTLQVHAALVPIALTARSHHYSVLRRGSSTQRIAAVRGNCVVLAGT